MQKIINSHNKVGSDLSKSFALSRNDYEAILLDNFVKVQDHFLTFLEKNCFCFRSRRIDCNAGLFIYLLHFILYFDVTNRQ